MIARLRSWSFARRIATLAIIVVIGSGAGVTHTVFEVTKPALAFAGLVIALFACLALGLLGAEWFFYPPPRK